MAECLAFISVVFTVLGLGLMVASVAVGLRNAPKDLWLLGKIVHLHQHWLDRNRDESQERKLLYAAIIFGIVGWVLLKVSELL